MSSSRSNTKTVLSAGLAALALIVALLLWIFQALTGIDVGLFDPANETVPTVETTPQSDWYRLYFTEPQDELTWSGGLDEVLAADFDRAAESILVAVYDFDLQSLTDALIRAHRRGVQVRMVTDSDNVELDQPQELIEAGIPVVADGRSAIMHNKFIVIDEVITWTGSWNLTDNGTYRNNNNAIRILSRRMAANYTQEFNEMFDRRAFGPESPADTPNPLIEFGATQVETFFAPEDHALEHVLAAVNGARQSIRFLAFSFTDDELGAVMVARANAGVLVEGVFEARNADSEYGEYATLKNAGLQVWLDGNPGIMHHKVIVIDNELVVTGSFNFSGNAEASNDENLLILRDPQIAARYLEEFDRMVAQAR